MRLLKADIAWGGKVAFPARGPSQNVNQNTKEHCAVSRMTQRAKTLRNENNFCDFSSVMGVGNVDMRFRSIILSLLLFNLRLMTE